MTIEIGCGHNPITLSTPDIFTRNVDYRVDLSRDSVAEAIANTIALPFRSESLDAMVCQHVIEHHTHCSFGDKPTYGTLLMFLKEVHRVLKPEGYIECMCPNMAFIAKMYVMGERTLANSMQLMQWAMGGQRDKFDHHGVLLDFHIITMYSEMAGFKSAKLLHPYDWFGLHFMLEK